MFAYFNQLTNEKLAIESLLPNIRIETGVRECVAPLGPMNSKPAMFFDAGIAFKGSSTRRSAAVFLRQPLDLGNDLVPHGMSIEQTAACNQALVRLGRQTTGHRIAPA